MRPKPHSLSSPEGDLSISARIAADIHELGRVTGAMIGDGESGVTIEQYWMLRLLHDTGPRPIKDVASEMGTTHSPVSISAKHLEQLGLVRRERNTTDERVVTVRLTHRGRTLFEGWRKGRRRALSLLFGSLNKKERVALLGLLDRLLAERSNQGKDRGVLLSAGSSRTAPEGEVGVD